ncbi:MAG: hypothetical protein WD834_05385 [Actinomycetota bacterium]
MRYLKLALATLAICFALPCFVVSAVGIAAYPKCLGWLETIQQDHVLTFAGLCDDLARTTLVAFGVTAGLSMLAYLLLRDRWRKPVTLTSASR